ncbi:putative metalloprotease CJM1_0395 family protein [Maricaulis sp.]|uniref:putative metalloprotease CJM1_0395 family protein n=1 Tax=Maricaulis sp. TaxID=1486257 RepID=UPI00262D781C|nr:putative metalloprotease CJM1_0395 family protein [Maricaulis sp.]
MSAISAYSGYVPPTPQPASPNASQSKSVASGCSNCGSGSCQGCGDKLSTQTDNKDAFTLSDAEQKQVNKLAARDREVRAHEQAHKAVGGQYTGAISYDYQRGPDGKQYAVGGEVPIDASEIPGDPAATIEKMRIVKAAALAPAEPSGQDRKVAAMADAKSAKARAELNAQKAEEADPNAPKDPQDQLSPDINAQLAEMRQQDEASRTGPANPAVAAPTDMTAYAANAYAQPSRAITALVA